MSRAKLVAEVKKVAAAADIAVSPKVTEISVLTPGGFRRSGYRVVAAVAPTDEQCRALRTAAERNLLVKFVESTWGADIQYSLVAEGQ